MNFYLSNEKLEEIKSELEQCKRMRREIADKIEAAKEMGDLSENFEYHTAKEMQGKNESRIVEIEDIIVNAIIVEKKKGGETVELGVTFEVETNGDKKVFTLVGSSEADPIAGKISNESPIGRSFVGRRVDETVEVSVPSGIISYKIIKIV